MQRVMNPLQLEVVMKGLICCAVAIFAMVTVTADQARANRISEVEGARANARAGGPVSEHDAWLLERYGALSGTRYYSKSYKRRYKGRQRRWRRRHRY